MSPIYIYQCPSCKKEVEVFRSIKDTSTTVCNNCMKPMEKQVTRASFTLHASKGFYGTKPKP